MATNEYLEEVREEVTDKAYKKLAESLLKSKVQDRQILGIVLTNIHSLAQASNILHDEIQALKALSSCDRPDSLADSYQGTFKQGHAYQRGSLATHGGSLWLALKDTGSRPAGPQSGWQLIVKGMARGK